MERGVIITLDNGALGRTQGVERFFGMILRAATNIETDGLIRAIHSLKEAKSWGIVESQNPNDYTVGTNYAYRQIVDFYSFPQNAGKKLWIYIVNSSLTDAEILDPEGSIAPFFLDRAAGEISVLFLGGNKSNPYVSVGGLSSEVFAALPKAQALGERYAAMINPLRIALDGYDFGGDASLLTDLRTMQYNRACINLATSVAGSKSSSQGLLAGRLAYIPVNESAGWVAPGSLPITTGFLTSGTSTESAKYSINDILDKGYISFQKYPQKYGYYFSDPRMATSLTDDYAKLTDGCVIDKAHILAYQTFVKYVNGQMYITSKGTLNLLQVKAMEADIENVITQQMIAKGECSFVKCYIDPTQKVVSTNELVIGVKVIPTATLNLLRIKLGFAQSV